MEVTVLPLRRIRPPDVFPSHKWFGRRRQPFPLPVEVWGQGNRALLPNQYRLSHRFLGEVRLRDPGFDVGKVLGAEHVPVVLDVLLLARERRGDTIAGLAMVS